MSGFRKFLMRGNLIELAVAVVIGVAFNAVIQALISDIITPLIAAIAGKPNFGALTFTVNHSKFSYGSFINALLSFVIIAAVVYFLIVSPMARVIAIRATGTRRPPSARARSASATSRSRPGALHVLHRRGAAGRPRRTARPVGLSAEPELAAARSADAAAGALTSRRRSSPRPRWSSGS